MLTLLASPAFAGEIFFDEARVVDTQPVYETRGKPVQIQQCGYEELRPNERVDPASLGNARSVSPSAGLVEALQTDIELRLPPEPVYRCRLVSRIEHSEELVGYRVRYEYDGRIYERQIAERPGETIRVRVRLGAGLPDLLTQHDPAGTGVFAAN